MNTILLHGLYTRSWIMKTLGRRLAKQGFRPIYFNYASTRANPRDHGRILADFIRREQLLPCHFVTHSLGGLVLRHLADIAPDLF